MDLLIITGLILTFGFLILTYWNIYTSRKYSTRAREFKKELAIYKEPVEHMNLLMEDMDYVILVKNILHKKFSNKVFVHKKNSDEILKLLNVNDPNFSTYKAEFKGFYDIISLPYFTLAKAIEIELIISFNEVNNYFNKLYFPLPILNTNLKNNDEYKRLFYSNELYAIPFTNIYTIFAFNHSIVQSKKKLLLTL